MWSFEDQAFAEYNFSKPLDRVCEQIKLAGYESAHHRVCDSSTDARRVRPSSIESQDELLERRIKGDCGCLSSNLVEELEGTTNLRGKPGVVVVTISGVLWCSRLA